MKNQHQQKRYFVLLTGCVFLVSLIGLNVVAETRGLMRVKPWLDQAMKDLTRLVEPGIVTMPTSRISEKQAYEQLIIQLAVPLQQAVDASGHYLDQQQQNKVLKNSVRNDVKLVQAFGQEYRSVIRDNSLNPTQDENTHRRVGQGMNENLSSTGVENRNTRVSREVAKDTGRNNPGMGSDNLRGLLRAEEVKLRNVNFNQGKGNNSGRKDVLGAGDKVNQVRGNQGNGNNGNGNQGKGNSNVGVALGLNDNPGQGQGNSGQANGSSGRGNNSGQGKANSGRGNNSGQGQPKGQLK